MGDDAPERFVGADAPRGRWPTAAALVVLTCAMLASTSAQLTQRGSALPVATSDAAWTRCGSLQPTPIEDGLRFSRGATLGYGCAVLTLPFAHTGQWHDVSVALSQDARSAGILSPTQLRVEAIDAAGARLNLAGCAVVDATTQPAQRRCSLWVPEQTSALRLTATSAFPEGAAHLEAIRVTPAARNAWFFVLQATALAACLAIGLRLIPLLCRMRAPQLSALSVVAIITFGAVLPQHARVGIQQTIFSFFAPAPSTASAPPPAPRLLATSEVDAPTETRRAMAQTHRQMYWRRHLFGVHFVLFGLSALAVCVAFGVRGASIAALLLWAFGAEWAQHFSLGRTVSAVDAAQNTLGVLSGASCVALARAALCRYRAYRSSKDA